MHCRIVAQTSCDFFLVGYFWQWVNIIAFSLYNRQTDQGGTISTFLLSIVWTFSYHNRAKGLTKDYLD